MTILKLRHPYTTGTLVKEVQRHLNRHGGKLAVDGAYGPLTEAAVIRFQRAQKIAVDGIVGPVTMARLRKVPGAVEPKPLAVPEVDVIHKSYKWAHPLSLRLGDPGGCVLHHSASRVASPADIHRWHLGRGYCGIGYHFVVRKNGKVYRGRPTWAMGGHTLGYNHWLGIVAEGDFTREKMPEKQRISLQRLCAQLARQYRGLRFEPHRAMPDNATVCPGGNYPLAKIRP